jgi:flagellar basal body-associated protein FliL
MPKSKRIQITIIVILIILLIIIAMLFINYSKNKSTPSSCNYNNPNRTYIKTTAPCIINFLCIQGKVAFSDKCGCGCENQ